MKCFKIRRIYKAPVSPPARGAWIEIPKAYTSFIKVRRRPPHGGRGLKSSMPLTKFANSVSPPARGAWIEIPPFAPFSDLIASPPARGAWIEIPPFWPRRR